MSINQVGLRAMLFFTDYIMYRILPCSFRILSRGLYLPGRLSYLGQTVCIRGNKSKRVLPCRSRCVHQFDTFSYSLLGRLVGFSLFKENFLPSQKKEESNRLFLVASYKMSAIYGMSFVEGIFI
jgi:hypothetical protein